MEIIDISSACNVCMVSSAMADACAFGDGSDPLFLLFGADWELRAWDTERWKIIWMR